MSSVTSLALSPIVVIGLLAIVFVVRWIRVIRDETSVVSTDAIPANTSTGIDRLQFVSSFAWLAVPFVVIGSFGVITEPQAFLLGWTQPSRHNERQVATSRLRETPATSTSTHVATVSTSGSTNRPTWLDQGRTVEGDCERVVLTSRQYTTREEAEKELEMAAIKIVETDLRRIQTGPLRPASWRPDSEDVIAHAVKDRFEEVIVRDFGSVTHPMHRVSWLVELSPAVRTEFVPAWRRTLISFRILLVACVASLFAMVVSASAVYLRLDSIAKSPSRGMLKLLTIGVTLGWFALALNSFREGKLW